MKNTDVFDCDETIIVLDRPYPVRLTIKAVFQLEERYGTMAAALAALCGNDAAQMAKAVVDFLCVLTGASPDIASGCLDAVRFPAAYEGLLRTIKRDLPYNEKPVTADGTAARSCDWSRLYYVGRYRLHMSDDEFFGSTFRRFFALHDLWLWDNSLACKAEQPEPEIYMGPLVH